MSGQVRPRAVTAQVQHGTPARLAAATPTAASPNPERYFRTDAGRSIIGPPGISPVVAPVSPLRPDQQAGHQTPGGPEHPGRPLPAELPAEPPDRPPLLPDALPAGRPGRP